MSQRRYHIAAALLRHNDHLLLVQQQGPADPSPMWALPGGVVEDGELLAEALIREIHEETGLTISQVGPLAYVSQLDNPANSTQSFAFIFEVTSWIGTLAHNDPDAVILDVAFYPISEAVAKVQTLPWQVMREPLIAYLQGLIPPGSVWLYRQGYDGSQQLITSIKAS